MALDSHIGAQAKAFGPIWLPKCQYDLEAHPDHIITCIDCIIIDKPLVAWFTYLFKLCNDVHNNIYIYDKVLALSYQRKSDFKVVLQAFSCLTEKLILHFLNKHICCGYSKKSSQRDASFEHPKQYAKKYS